jgi:hypothetical protein
VLTAFVVGLAVSTYYSAKLNDAQRRAEQAEARLKQTEQQQQVSSPPENREVVTDAPTDLVCPHGMRLQRVVTLDGFLKDTPSQGENASECVGKPRRVALVRVAVT